MFGLSKKEKQQKLKTQYNTELSELLIKINSNIDRSNLFASIRTGTYDQSDALHNVYHDFGYPCELSFFNLINMYRRFGPAAAVVDIPPDLSWLTSPTIKGNEKFNSELKKLIKKTKLWNRTKGLDKRQRVGRYAGMFIEISDNKKPDQPVGSLSGIANIRNLKPMYEGQLHVLNTEQDVTKDNYAQPIMYEFRNTDSSNKNPDENTSFHIHPDRLIIAAEGADDGSIYGFSSLENIFNDLMDLRKISGAGGEGFYQNTRSAPVIEIDKDTKAPTEPEQEKLTKELDDFLSKYQKKFIARGMKFVYPNIKLDSPKEFAENSWNNISSGSKISTNILRGVQTGVLAGDKDSKSTMIMIQSRRENFLTELVTTIIDWFIFHKVLPFSDYEIVWDDLTAASEDEKLDIGKKMAEINEKAFKSGMSPVFTEDEIREASGKEPLEFEIPNEKIDDKEDLIDGE